MKYGRTGLKWLFVLLIVVVADKTVGNEGAAVLITLFATLATDAAEVILNYGRTHSRKST